MSPKTPDEYAPEELLFLRIDIMNALNRAKNNLESNDIDSLMKLYHALCDFNDEAPNEYFFMQDKNEFRKLKESDLVENRKWYHDLIESVREDIDRMLEIVR